MAVVDIIKRGWTARRRIARNITKRRRADETLRESEERHRMIVENIHEVVYVVQTENDSFGGTVQYVGGRVKDILGYEPDEFLRDPGLWFQTVHPDDVPSVEETTLKILESGKAGTREYRLRHKETAEYRWMEDRVVPRVDEGGRVVAFQGVARDITERKRAEEALRESEERYRTLFELASDAFLTVLPDGKILDPNMAAAEMLGYSREELRELPGGEQIIAPEVLEETEREWRKQLGEKGHFLIETVWVRKDGSRVPVAVSGKTLEVRGRLQFQLIGRDITERKQAEEALGDSKLLLAKTFASLDEAVFVVEPNTRTIIVCNPAAERIFGYSEKEMVGRNTEFLHVDRAMYEEFGRELFPALDADGVLHTEYQMRRKDGTVLSTEHTVTEMVDDSGQRTGLVSVVRDITERKRMEEALRAAREELEAKVERQLLRRNPYGLTFRELTVLHLVAAGRSDREIGTKLGISPLTAQKHLENIRSKMEAASRTEASVRAVREGLLE